MVDRETVRQIGVYLDEIADLSRAVDPAKLREIRARVEVIKHALGDTTGAKEANVTDTGSLPEYLPDWDLPDAEAAARNGVTEQMVNAVKIALESKGIQLKYPSDPKYHGQGWHLEHGGLPPDWEERIRSGQPLS